MKKLKKDLITACELKTAGKNRQAFEIYEKCYKSHPEEFSFNQKNDHAWTIYKAKIQYYTDEDDLLENARYITELVEQLDFNKKDSCAYTAAVFKILNHFKNKQDFPSMIPWLEKLNPDLLDEKLYRKNARFNKSHKELYFDCSSKAYYQTFEFEKCIEVSECALDSLKRFLDNGDSWHRFRIAKSLIELGHLKEGLEYFEKVIEVLNHWYIYRDIAEAYYKMGKPLTALDYLCPAVLSDESNQSKANIYYSCYRIFKTFNPQMAIKHAQLYYLLKKENDHPMPYEIEKLGFDESQRNRSDLESEIRNLWIIVFYQKFISYG